MRVIKVTVHKKWSFPLRISSVYVIKFEENSGEGVHLTLPPHIISIQVKSWSMLHHGSVGASLKQNKRNLKKPNPNPNP